MKSVKIGFIGGGNMGGAMIEALWRAQSDEAGTVRNSADAGVRGGLPRQLCYDAVAAAVEGTARLIQSGKHPAALKDEVCSPAGTTIEGLAALENGGFRGALMDAVAACIAKARG